MKKKTKNKKGFSFLEVIISVFLIVIGIVAALSLFSKEIGRLIESRNQIIAGLLAQEGVELVRNLRDNNVLNNKLSFADPRFPASNADDCIIDHSFTELDCDGNSFNDEERLFFDNVYKHESGDETKYKRKIAIVYIDSNAEITSMVTWSNDAFPDDTDDCNTLNKCAWAQTILTNWNDI